MSYLSEIMFAVTLCPTPARISLAVEHGTPATPTEIQDVLNFLTAHYGVTFKEFGNLIASELSDDWSNSSYTGTPPGALVFTNSSFNGSGLPVTLSVPQSNGFMGNDAMIGSQANSPGPDDLACSLDLGAPRENVRVTFNFFGTAAGEQLRNISPAFDTMSGDGTAVLGNTGVDPTIVDGSITLTWNNAQIINFNWQDTGSGASSVGLIEFS